MEDLIPVKDWSDAGADVDFSTNTPDWRGWESIRATLLALGRPGNVFHYGGSTTYFRHTGTSLLGRRNGATVVVDEVLRWLESDLKRLFGALPGSDGSFAPF